MLYLSIPLGIAVVAVFIIAVMVWRKMPYLRKMTPESHEMGDTFLHDYAPEALDWMRGVPWRQYLHRVLVEFERLLYRARAGMNAMDRASARLVNNVRKVGQETAKTHEAVVAQLEQERKEKEEEQDPDEIDMADPEQVRAEEQRLIVAIAQHPKEVDLYSQIARVYMRLHNYADAVEALTQATKLEPGNEQYLKRLERARRKQTELVTKPTE